MTDHINESYQQTIKKEKEREKEKRISSIVRARSERGE